MKKASIRALIAVAIILALAACASIPFVRAHRKAFQRRECINNLRQIAGSKGSCSLALRLTNGAAISWDKVGEYIKNGTNSLWCPADPGKGCLSSYELGPIGAVPRCKIAPDEHSPFPPKARMFGMQIIVDNERRKPNGHTADD